jgi:hypothetical protein
MKTRIITLFLFLFLVEQIQAAAPTAPLLFRPGEWQLDLNGTATTTPTDNLNYGGGFGVNWFPWRTTGFGLDLQSEDTGSAFFDRISVGPVLRFPIEKWKLAPELRMGYSYDFELGDSDRTNDDGETFYTHGGHGHELFLGAGAEYRLTKSIGVGSEARWIEPLDGRKGYWMGLARLRFNF